MLVFDVLGIRDERLIWCVYEQLKQILLLLPFKLNLKPQWSSQISFAMKLPVDMCSRGIYYIQITDDC